MALETMVAARISEEANTVRNCCRPDLCITRGIRAPVTTIRTIDKENSKTSEIFRFNGMLERTMIGIGKAIRKTSVTMSQMPMVSSCA
jgi:hypothetical protein